MQLGGHEPHKSSSNLAAERENACGDLVKAKECAFARRREDGIA